MNTLLSLGLMVFLASQAVFGAEPVLRVQLPTEPVSLDPALAEDGVSLKILTNLMDGLVGYDGGGKLQNRLAKSYRISQGGKRYEFTLRSDARWSDGQPVRPADFIKGFERVLQAGTTSKLARMLSPIRRSGIREEGGRLIIELERPASYFIHTLTLPVAFPIRLDSQGRWVENGPTTGPYRIISHTPEQKIVLASNPHYYSKVVIPSVEFLIVPDEFTGMNLFETGKLDILTRVYPAEVARFKKSGVLRTDPLLATYFLSFNLRKPPFDDRDWRRAVSGSIEREQIVAAIGFGDAAERPARSWVPPGLEGHIPFENPSRVFADSIGEIDQKNKKTSARIPVTAGFDSSSRNTMIMEKVQQDLARKLNLSITLENLDWKSHIKSMEMGPPAIFRFGWLAAFMDPVSYLQAFTTGDPNNYPKWSNPEYDRLVAEIIAMPPGAKRVAKIRAAQSILVDRDAVVVPIYHYIQNHAVASKVRGFRVNALGMTRFDELSVTEGSGK